MTKVRRHRFWIAVAIVAAVVFFLASAGGFLWWPESLRGPIDVKLSDITSIEIEPYPEGPPGPVWMNPPTGPFVQQRHQVEAAIPSPLPPPLVQPIWCSVGGNLTVHLRDRSDIIYGPCRHPATIRALWAAIVRADTEGRCREPCAPTE